MTDRGTTVMPRCSTSSGARSAVESVTIATFGIGGPGATIAHARARGRHSGDRAPPGAVRRVKPDYRISQGFMYMWGFTLFLSLRRLGDEGSGHAASVSWSGLSGRAQSYLRSGRKR